MKTRALFLIPAFSAVFFAASLASANQDMRLKDMHVPDGVSRSQPLGHSDPNRPLHLCINIPPADLAGMEAMAADVSNPNSPNYRHFLTPEEVGERFGISDDKFNRIVDFLSAKGFNITMVGKSRLNILADCTAGQAEAALQTRIENFKPVDPKDLESGRPTYFSYTVPPALPSDIAPYVRSISGLDNFARPRKRTTLTPVMTRTLYNLAPSYASYKGQGRAVAITNFDGFRLSNVPLFYSAFGLPAPAGGVGSNIQVITIGGGSGTGGAFGEGDLDIQMVLGEAPLCRLLIYDGVEEVATIAKEADDDAADLLSESWGWRGIDDVAAHAAHTQMTLQGQTYFVASGDDGTDFLGFDYPDYDPDITNVGGTVATTDSTGKRMSEVGWNGSGGGWSLQTASYNVLPSWQKGMGVPTNINHRLVPDISLQADGPGGAFFIFYNGARAGFSGTSCSSPCFAGALAVIEQREIAKGTMTTINGKKRAGCINQLIYGQNGRSSIWLDIVSGSNGTLPNGVQSNAHAGWDFVDGWGVPNFDNFTFVGGKTLINTYSFMSIPQGSIVSGDPVVDTATINGVSLNIRPIAISGVGMAGSVAYRSVLPTTVGRTQVTEFDVSVNGKFATNATGQIYLFNYSTGAWNIAKSFPMGATATTNSFALKSGFTSYISAAGEIRVMIRGLLPSWAGTTGNYVSLDKVGLSTVYVPTS